MSSPGLYARNDQGSPIGWYSRQARSIQQSNSGQQRRRWYECAYGPRTHGFVTNDLGSSELRTSIGNVFIFLVAGHEVGHSAFLKSLSDHVVPDDCTRPCIYFRFVGSLPGYPREIVSSYQANHSWWTSAREHACTDQVWVVDIIVYFSRTRTYPIWHMLWRTWTMLTCRLG